ncbi:MAG: hypothetical protein RLY49_514 [Candidatus Parcubacteria bacterium]
MKSRCRFCPNLKQDVKKWANETTCQKHCIGQLFANEEASKTTHIEEEDQDEARVDTIAVGKKFHFRSPLEVDREHDDGDQDEHNV